MMMMILGPVGRVVARAEFKDVRERGDEEEQELQEQLLRGADTEQERNHEQELHFD